ncbi:MAG: preprotein translocase subunit SecY [Deltaproteobacteria bacterium RIFOXYB12_FULL_58_9]|nr:MAG: preprotein translocase subunit SecY [Deltaproteobacteria bacterium RIFOXYB12_FULL_58_9]
MASGFWNIGKIPELRNRILFTAALLAVYRMGIFISTPGIDRVALGKAFAGAAGTLFGIFNMFSGGAFEQASIFALGIMPYISSSIIMQLLTVVIPTLERLQKEGESGRNKINQYTRYGTIVLSVVQGFGVTNFLKSGPFGTQVVDPANSGPMFYFTTILTLVAGTTFIMWLGEQITERGIGNGISLLIFAGIVARFPESVKETYTYVKNQMIEPLNALVLIAMLLFVVSVIIFFEQAQRRIPVQYAKRLVGKRTYAGQSTHLPLKINPSGVIPPIFASSLLMLPATIGQFAPVDFIEKLTEFFSMDAWFYNTTYVLLIIFFCYFYTSVTFNPVDVADNMKKYGGYIPGIRPGKKTAEYIDHVLSRIVFGGALYLSAVCVMPTILINKFDAPQSLAYFFGGTSILIVVGVALDTVRQIESHLITRHYDGFAGSKGPRIRGRR